MQRQHVFGIALVVTILIVLGVLLFASGPGPAAAEAQRPASANAAAAATSAEARKREAQDRQLAATAPASGQPDAAPPPPDPERLCGRVIAAADKAAIAGAEVQLQFRDGDQFWNLDLDYEPVPKVLATAKSDHDGRFAFAVARAQQHRLHVAAANFAPMTVSGCCGGTEVTVELAPGASLDGTVRCDGTPVIDVPVRIAVAGESVELAIGRTDADGGYRFTGLPPAKVFVQVRSPNYEEKWQSADLLPGGSHHVDVELTAGATLRGRVVDAESGAPVAAAEVTDSWTFKRVVHTGVDGRFELPGLRDEGYVEVHVRAAGYAKLSTNLASQLGREAELKLVRGGEVRGRLLTTDGRPAADTYAALGASFEQGPGMMSTDWIRARVDPDGRFLALGLRPDQHYWLYVRGRGLGTRIYALPRQLLAGERCDLGDFVLRAAGGVEGRVVDETGTPWPQHEVGLHGSNADSRHLLPQGAQPLEVSQFRSRDTRTDASGTFRFTGLAAGSYQLTVRLAGSGQATQVGIEIVDGETKAGVDLVLLRGKSIAGTVRFGDGRALGDAAADLYVSATSGKHERSIGRVTGDGRFEIVGLQAGEYALSMLQTPKGWALSPLRGVAAGTLDVQLLLQPAAYLRGRVVDADGHGVKSTVFALPDSGDGALLHATDDDGRFEIEVPADFHGKVSAMHPQQRLLRAQVDDVGAGRSDLELRLSPPQPR